MAFRPEGSLIYVNADAVLESVLNRLQAVRQAKVGMVVCDLSASPHLDLAGSNMLKKLHSELASRDIRLRVIGPIGPVRDLLRADGMDGKLGGLDRAGSLDRLLCEKVT